MFRQIVLGVSAITVFMPSGFAAGALQSDITTVVSKASSSVVLIKGTSTGGVTLVGSGFLVSSDGKIATNLHVLRDLKSAAVRLPNGEVYDSFRVVAFDERKDLAVIRIAGFDLPILEMGNSNDVKPGETVIAIGNPDALSGTVTKGIVSAIRDDPGGRGFRVIQTDAAVNPGNSGGPLINEKGQVVGIVSAKIKESENLNFAMPINYLRGLMDSLEAPLTLDEMRSKLGSLHDTVFAQPERKGGVLVAGYGAPIGSFQTIFLELMNYISTSGVAVANTPGPVRPIEGDEASLAYLVDRVSKFGADSILYLIVEHGFSNIHRAKLQCFDADGKLLWTENASSTWTWATTEQGAAKAVAEQLEKKLKSHIGKTGLQLRRKP